jgi:hypothetical protein
MQCNHLWVFFLVLQVLSVFQVKGQEQRKDTIPIPRSIQNKRDLQLQPTQSSLPTIILKPWNSDENLREISINRKVPCFNINQKLKYSNGLPGDSSSLFLPVYLGLGDYQNFGGTLGSFNLTNKFALDYGAFISAQYGYLFSTHQIVWGSNFLLHYAITNKLQLQTRGQYVTPGNSSDPTFNMRTFFPTTNFGAGLQYDSNENTKIKVGIEYQYDQSDKTWKSESGGKVFFKF